MAGRTLYDKLWDSHVVADLPGGETLLYIDRQLVHEVSSPQAFAAMRTAGRTLRRPETHLAVADHAVPTRQRSSIADPLARAQVAELEENAAHFGVPYLALQGEAQGIVHVIGPEQGFTLPGITLVCGDSHTSTHGAFGALAFGIGSTESSTVMAAQCLKQKKAKRMRVNVTGSFGPHVSAKDIALAFIAQVGALGAVGYAVEYAGPAIRQLSMAGRMTLCNMTIEAGSRIGIVAPDETTFAFVEGRRLAPKGAQWEAAKALWRTLITDEDAQFDREVTLDLSAIEPQVSWGTTPDETAPISGHVPDPAHITDPARRAAAEKAIRYMGLTPGQKLTDIAITHVFIGSCTNSRIEDLRAAAEVVRDRQVAQGVKAIVVPGSAATKAQAENEGLDRIFTAAGFEWRFAGCSMCVGMNDDRMQAGERSASTSNRNFEGRQGPGARTHLMSPVMAAAAGIAGHLADVRELTA